MVFGLRSSLASTVIENDSKALFLSRILSLRVFIPVLLDHVYVGCFGSHEIAVTRNVFLIRHDLEWTFNHRREAEVWLVRMDAHVLWCTEVFRTAEDGSRHVLTIDLSREGHPVGSSVIAFPAVFAVAGQILYVTRIDAVVILFPQPLNVAAECHAAVVWYSARLRGLSDAHC